jgi:hypothetical protein
MNKSNFQLLSEDLEKEVLDLQKEIKNKKQLLEKAPDPSFGKADYSADYSVLQPNIGGFAGFGVGDAANPSAIVMNPNVLAAAKGKILPDADPRVVKYQPYYSNNLATMMGLGVDMATFARAKEFMNMYSPVDGGVAEKDDPEQSVALDWKRLNNAVSAHSTQRIKEKLSQNHLFNGNGSDPYSQGVPDTYQRFVVGKKAQKAVEDTVTNILGKPSKSRGKDVTGYVRQLSQGQKERMGSMWSQNPDQSGKIKLGR